MRGARSANLVESVFVYFFFVHFTVWYIDDMATRRRGLTNDRLQMLANA
jgi:hypothetical protein